MDKTGANSGTEFTPIDPEKIFLFAGSSKGITSGDPVEYTIDNIALEPGVYDAQMTFEYGTQKKNCQPLFWDFDKSLKGGKTINNNKVHVQKKQSLYHKKRLMH